MEIDEPTRAQYDELTRLADEMDVGSRGPKLTGPISVPGKGVFDSETGEMLQEFKPLRGPGGVSRPTTTEVPDDTELVDSPPEADARQPVTRLVADLRGRLAVDGDVSPERRRAFGAATAPGRETNAVLQAIATAEGRLSAGEPDSRVTDELYDEVKGILDTETGGLSGPTGQVREAAMPLADGPRLDGLPRLSDELPEPPATQWDPDPAKVRAAYDKFNFAQHNVTFDEVLDHLPEVSAQQPPPWDTEVAGRIRQENIRSGIPPMSKEQHAVAQAIGDLSRGKGLELRFRDQEARELEGLTGQVREGEQVDAFGDDLRGAQEEMELGRVTPRRLAGPSGRGTLAASERLARTTVDRLRPIVESGEATPDQREQYRQAVAMLRRNDALSAEEAGLLGQSETPPDTESGDLFGEIEGPGRPPPGRVRETDTNSLSPQPGEDVRAYTDRIKRQRDERRQAALDVVREEYGGLELGDRPIELGLVSMGDRRHVAAITPSTEPSRGAVRATFFNEDGPWTHQYYASVEDAVASISDDHGVASAAPGSVDELFRLESFQKGLEHIKKIAEWNRRLAAGEEPPPPDEIDVGEVREDVPQFNSPEDVPANAGWIAEQLGLFSDNVTWGSPEKAAAAKKNIAAANAKLLSELSPARREQEVADAVRRREENILTIDHRGKQISSDPDQAAKDVALLQAPFRGPDSEHLSAYLTVNGEVAGHVMVTSGKVNYTGFEDHHTADIEALIKQHGVTDAWLSHNHPSGRSISSPEDDTLTGEFEKWFASRGVKLRGHVVIDHGTAYEIMTKQSLTYDPAGVPDWTRQRLRKEVVNSPAEIAKMAGPIAGPDALSLLFVDTMGKVVSLSPESKGLVQALSSPGWLFDRLTGLGAYRAFIAIDVKNKDFDGLFDALVNAVNMNGLLRAIPHKGKAANQNGLLDIVGVDGFSLVRSARNKGLLYFTPESTTHARRVMEEPDDNVQGSGEPGAPSASARPVGSQPTAGPAAVSRGGAVLGLRGPGGVAPTSGRLGGPQGREGDPARPTGIVRDVESQFDEVEKRWRAAKGLGKETESRALDALDAVRKSFLRHFRYIDQSESAAKSHTHDILRRLEAAPNYAKSTTADQLVRINADMGPADRDQLARLLVLPDILKDVEAGLYDGKDLPFGYESPSDIASDLQRFQDAASPQVQEALERRREIAGDLTQRMVDAGLLPKKVLEDDRYYHRQVLDYFRLRDIQFPGTGSADARLHTKGFQRQRVGGGDFNTRWQEAEFEWMSQAESLLQRKAALDALESVWNIKPGLKRQARAANRAAFAAIVGDADAALKPFSTKIAIANDGLGKLAEQGSIPSGPFDHVWAALGQERAQHNAARAALPRGQKGTQPPLRFQHEDWFPALAWLLEQGGEGAGMAGSIFKAIAERERLIKETVGNKYVTWEDLVPDAHPRAPGERAVTWQPEKGNHFFLAPTVQERVLHRAQSEMRPLTDDETRMMLVMGGPKEQWVVPESIQRTLDEFGGRFGDDVGLEQAARYLTSSWKQWVLLNPVRAVKYNVNNQSGDMDIAIAYKPEIVTKRMVPAARDLALWRHGSDPSPEMQAEMDEALRLGVIDSGLTIAEIPEINDIGVFRKLADPGADASAFQNLVDKYWNSVRAATTWRENTLRLAAWRYFLEHPNETGVSNPEHVAGIPDERERAAKLARELIGDYGNLSEAGMWLRKHALPFWSWAEINAPRYVRLFRNTQFEGTAGLGKAARVGGKRAAGKGAKFLIQANILFGLINLWNWTQHPEEAAELQRGRRQLHLILGRREDGSIRSVRFQGALSDALEWINLGDWPADIADIMEGKADLADIAAEAAKGPVEKLVNMVNPFASTAVEMFTGRSAFPRLFEEGASLKPRPSIVRDRKERAFAMWSLDGIYRRVTGKPRKPTTGPVNTVLDALITYSTDPGEASYWLVRGETVDWMRESGREFPDVTPTERSNALYYFKKATAWGDEAAADRWLRRYYELGGTAKGLQQSVRRAHPLGAIPQGMRASFIESLNERDREALRRALQWYTETYGSRANTDATEPGETPARGRLNGPRQAAGGTGGR
jgi:DNA repair protein RadC